MPEKRWSILVGSIGVLVIMISVMASSCAEQKTVRPALTSTIQSASTPVTTMSVSQMTQSPTAVITSPNSSSKPPPAPSLFPTTIHGKGFAGWIPKIKSFFGIGTPAEIDGSNYLIYEESNNDSALSTYLFDNIYILNVNNPDSPIEISKFPDKYIKNLKVWGNCIYVIHGDSSYYDSFNELQILDVSNPDHLQIMKTISQPFRIDNIQISGHFLFVELSNGLINILDISQPSAPLSAGIISAGGNALADVSDNSLYVYGYDLLQIFDFSKPESPKEIGRFDFGNLLPIPPPGNPSLGGSITGMAVIGDNVYIAAVNLRVTIYGESNKAVGSTTQSGIFVINVSNPANLVLLPTSIEFDYATAHERIFSFGPYLCLWPFSGSLSIQQFSDGTKAREIGRAGISPDDNLKLAFMYFSPVKAGEYLYANLYSNGLNSSAIAIIDLRKFGVPAEQEKS
jgi:hypothetical protein